MLGVPFPVVWVMGGLDRAPFRPAFPTPRLHSRQRILQLIDGYFSLDFLAPHVPATVCRWALFAVGTPGGSITLMPANGRVLLTEGRGFRLVAAEFTTPVD